MGVWIETMIDINPIVNQKSHPVWVCGLKLIKIINERRQSRVTPCMGVWIETRDG